MGITGILSHTGLAPDIVAQLKLRAVLPCVIFITNDPTLPDAGGLVIVNVAILPDAVARDASK